MRKEVWSNDFFSEVQQLLKPKNPWHYVMELKFGLSSGKIVIPSRGTLRSLCNGGLYELDEDAQNVEGLRRALKAKASDGTDSWCDQVLAILGKQ